jgi:hypothetical protein
MLKKKEEKQQAKKEEEEEEEKIFHEKINMLNFEEKIRSWILII